MQVRRHGENVNRLYELLSTRADLVDVLTRSIRSWAEF